ncbi:MAG: polynucleotide kinase-phosphatase, partial [Candidatus Kapaibacterium sp.]
MNITIPELSLVVLIGASGSGKSTFARKHFKPTETISSDYCRAIASDDENDLSATDDAFRILNYIAATRLRRGNFTVIDATSVQPEARKPLVALAREHDVQPVAIVMNISERICQDRHAARTDRSFGEHVIRRQRQSLKRSLRDLRREGFRHIHILSTPEEVDAVTITRTPLWNDRRNEHGPFDIIGDIHGCCDELEMLLENLGYQWRPEEITDDAARGASRYGRVYVHPEGRKAVFVGDIVDRGPRILESYELVRNMVRDGGGICVPGNHDIKLVKKLRGKNVMVRHGLEQTVAEIDAIPEETRAQYSEAMASFFDSLVSHYLFDDGGLVVAHAGMKESFQGRASGRVREFALYGETTGETDEFGLPVRYNWAADYRGRARVVYGHTPVPDPEWLNGTINIDTGCVFGGRLTALRYPELVTMSVPAARVYAEPSRPFLPEDGAVVEDADDMLDLEDIFGKRQITTRLHRGITIREENSRAALEVMSRFALDPRWLIYLPPTMSPTTTSTEPGLLEHPADAFAYYRRHGVTRLVCEEKHMGSRAVIVLCRDGDAAARRFGVSGALAGVCYTRTGRAFFDGAEEHELLKRLRAALDETGFWEEFSTDWVCLDCELMPWSAKAQDLLQRQYASVGAAAREGFA